MITVRNFSTFWNFSTRLFGLGILFSVSACSSGLNEPPSDAVNSSISGTGPVVADGKSKSQITISLADAEGNPIVGFTPTFEATNTNSKNNYGACTASNDSGISSCWMTSEKAEIKKLRITSPIVMDGGTVEFKIGEIKYFTLVQQPTPLAIAGESFNPVPELLAWDEKSNAVTQSSAQVTIAPYLDANCTVPASGTFAVQQNPIAVNQTVKFQNITYTKAEVIYLGVSFPAAETFCFDATEVRHNIAHHLTYATQPGAATAGQLLNVFPKVEIRDVYENVVNTGGSASSTVTLSAFGDAACTNALTTTLAGNSMSAVEGKAWFTNFTTTKAQNTYLRAFVSGLSPICSNQVSVSPYVPSSSTSTITGTGPIAANQYHASTITIGIYDQYSNPIPSIVPTFSATNTGGTNQYSACGATNGSGLSNCTLKSLNYETKQLTLESPVVVNGGSVSFLKPPASNLSTIQADTNVVANGSSTSTVTVTLLDQDSQPVVGLTPVLSVTGTDNTVSACSIGNASGVSTCTLKTTKAENKTISLTSPLILSGPTITFINGPATKLVMQTQPSSTLIAGQNLGTAPKFYLQDANNNLVTTGATATTAVTLSAFTDSNCTVASSTNLGASTNPVSASAGLVDFSNVNLSKAETVYLRASASGMTSACTNAIVVSPAAYSPAQSTLAVSAATLNSGNSITATLTAKDAYGNTNPSGVPGVGGISFHSTLVGGTGTFGSISSAGSGIFSATFTGQAAGSVTLSAKISGVSIAQTQTVTVDPGTASQLVFDQIPSSAVQKNRTWTNSVLVQTKDAFGNLTSNTNSITIQAFPNSNCTGTPNGTLSFTANPKSAVAGTATFQSPSYSAAETLYLKANASGLASACSSVIDVSNYRNLNTTNAPTARRGAMSAWTGSLFLIWGGQDENSNYLTSGAVYNPTTDAWADISNSSAPSGRKNAVNVWVGNKFLVWGGEDANGVLGDGAVYNPNTDTWSPISSQDAPSARTGSAAIWDGSKMYLFGGFDGVGYSNEIFSYDPQNNTWVLEGTGILSARSKAMGIHDSGKWYLVGGADSVGPLSDGVVVNLANYNLDAIPENQTLGNVMQGEANVSFDGSKFFVLGSLLTSFWDVLGNSWEVTDVQNEFSRPRTGYVFVKTDTNLIVFGGKNASNVLQNGTAFNLNSLSWSALPSTTNLPSARWDASAVWTGSEVLIFGGCTTLNCNAVTNTSSSFKE